mgnify:CR=1 FL=1
MCGIVGAISKNRNVLPILITGLKNLEYRGYDSAGVAYLKNNKINIVKTSGKIIKLESKLNKNDKSNMGIAHTRWATHGKANSINAHPHNVKHVTIVHNGIIENYEEIKEMLEKENYSFKSSTDTEVACALLNYYYEKYNDVDKTIKAFMEKVIGSYAILMIIDNDLDNLYVMKKESPLVIGISDKTNIVASDIRAILKYTNKYFILDDFEYARVNANEVVIKSVKGDILNKELHTIDIKDSDNSKGHYKHYMLKEIMEQKTTILKTVLPFIKEGLDSLKTLPDLTKYKEITIVGCGTAYHAGLVAKYLFEEVTNTRCNVYLASEFRYHNNFLSKDTLTIFISQSGETADTIAALKLVKSKHYPTLGIINVEDSTISYLVDTCLYTKAGSEIAVASTKAYTAQVALLSILALSHGLRNKTISKEKVLEVIDEFNNIEKLITPLLNNKDTYLSIAKTIYKEEDIFYIGRGLDYYLSMEGALKLKEISYIHSEAYAAGELKHGTISLIKKNTPVLASATNSCLNPKTISNLKEVLARGADIYLICDDNYKDDTFTIVKIPKASEFIKPILVIIPYQLIAYYTATLKGTDIDKPKNLAKSVTVE